MSFPRFFEKLAFKPEELSDIELTIKANKHLRGAIKNEKAPLTMGALGAVAGGLSALAVKDKKLIKGILASIVGGAAGAAAGKGIKDWHESRLRKASNELARRGIYAVPRGDSVFWVKKSV